MIMNTKSSHGKLNINTNFINDSKSWEKRRKFVDKWAGIRLIYSNSTKNLIYLYATDVAAKQFYR